MSKKQPKIHKLNSNQNGIRLEKKLTRIERIEKTIKEIATMPQYFLQRFQIVLKAVEDIRFTYEVIGQILQEKGIITQEELTKKGNYIIEERKKEREKKLEEIKNKQSKDNKENIFTEEQLKSEVSRELMQPREDLQAKQIQDKDVSIKEID